MHSHIRSAGCGGYLDLVPCSLDLFLHGGLNPRLFSLQGREEVLVDTWSAREVEGDGLLQSAGPTLHPPLLPQT